MIVDETTALNVFRKIISNEDRTYAQVLYRRFADETFNNPTNENKLHSSRNARESVSLINNLIKETSDKYFTSIGQQGLSEIFFQELENQRKEKQEKIKHEAIEKDLILWHATPLSKDELDGGVLKGTTERPDLLWEKVFTGVCAFPQSTGAYAIKKAKDERDFACKGENLVRLTDNRLDNVKNEEVLGYIHGHRLSLDDGFIPTISLDGSVSGEWTTEKEVTIDVTKEVTLNYLRENGVHIFAFDKLDNDLVKKMTQGKTIEEQISMFEEMAVNPNKTYTDESGNSQKIKIKDYYNQTESSSPSKTIAELRRVSSETKVPYKPKRATIDVNSLQLYRNSKLTK